MTCRPSLTPLISVAFDDTDLSRRRNLQARHMLPRKFFLSLGALPAQKDVLSGVTLNCSNCCTCLFKAVTPKSTHLYYSPLTYRVFNVLNKYLVVITDIRLFCCIRTI